MSRLRGEVDHLFHLAAIYDMTADEERNRLHMINATGLLVWACLDGEASLAEIVDDISDELGVERDTVLADTLAVTRHLGEQGLIANVTPDPDLGEKIVGLPADRPPEAAEDDCVDEATEAEPSPPDDPRFVAEPPNP